MPEGLGSHSHVRADVAGKCETRRGCVSGQWCFRVVTPRLRRWDMHGMMAVAGSERIIAPSMRSCPPRGRTHDRVGAESRP